uniref:Uncharacterized protein n=1 Tax=Populus trichocarpa TaxID=3694 RepID=B9I7Y4_POPTR
MTTRGGDTVEGDCHCCFRRESTEEGSCFWKRIVWASSCHYFPTLIYSVVKGLKIGKDALECVVRLNEFEDDETLRLIAP